MNKNQLIKSIVNSQGLGKEEAKNAVEVVFSSIIEAMSTGYKLELRGFGSFKVRQRKGRTGRNPKTGYVVNVPAKKVPMFKAGKILRAMVDGKV